MFAGMLDGLKEESVGFLFNVSVEAVPPQQVSPVLGVEQEPDGLAEFAAAAAGAQKRSGATREPASALRAKGIDNEAAQLTYTGPAEDGSAQVQGNGDKSQAGGGSRRDRREAARRQGKHARAKRR
jgi:preprotein translocase subunit SecA